MSWRTKSERSWGRLGMKCKLEDIVDVTMGQSPKSEYYNTEGKGYPFLQGNRTFGFKYPTFDTYTTVMTKPANAGDVIMSVRAPVGDLNITPVDMCLGRGVCSLRMKNGNQDFLFYMMKYYIPHLLKKESGTVFGSVNRNDINGLEVDIPEDAQVQKKIARYLEMIDDKIELNNAINKNLSNLLQAIYQQQFVNVGLVTNQGILSDICSYSKEKVAVSELNVNNYFSTENMLPEKAGSTKATSLPTTPQTTACRKGDTLISNIRPYFKKIVYCEDMCGCSTDVLCFTPVQSQYAAYLFSTLYNDKFFAFMVAGSKGTKMPRGDKQQIMTYPVVLPAESELEEFNAFAFPILEQLNSNSAENKRLSALRDALLPKLMSGELDVSDIDI